jgi:hypothetical protein
LEFIQSHSSAFKATLAVVVLFPIAVFLLSRQIVANATGIGKNSLSALFVAALSLVAIAAFERRLEASRPDFRLTDTLTLAQAAIAGIIIALYLLSGSIEPSEAVSSTYYYCLAPFLVYAGFLASKLPQARVTSGFIALSMAYLLTLVAGICEVMGSDYWLFANENWYLQQSGLGFSRATGLYGSQIDYGCLSFMVFCIFFYARRLGTAWPKKLMIGFAWIGLLLSMSRVWVAAAILVVVVDAVASRSWKRVKRLAVVGALFLAALYPVADSIGLLDFVTGRDEMTHTSNEDRRYYYRMAPKWLLNDYPLVGTGPGTQNGPDVHGKKMVFDALWLATLVELGTSGGFVVLCLRIGFILYVLWRAWKHSAQTVLRPLTIALALSQLVASLVDSVFGHPVTITIFYIIAGLFLYRDSEPAALVGVPPPHIRHPLRLDLIA